MTFLTQPTEESQAQPVAPSVASGGVYVSLQTIVQQLILIAYFLAIARFLSQRDLGQISILNLIMAIFGLLTTLAIPAAATKYIADGFGRNNPQQASGVAKVSLRILLTTSIPTLLVAIALSPILAPYVLGESSDPAVIMLALGTAFTGNLSSLLGSQLLGLGAFEWVASQGVLSFLSSRASAVAMAYLGFGVKGVAAGWLIGALIGLSVGAWAVRGRFASARVKFPVRVLLSFSAPILLANVIATVQNWADIVVLYSWTADLAGLGVYWILVSAIGNALTIFYAPISTAIFPSIAFNFGRGDNDEVRRKIQNATRLVLITVVPVSFALAASSQTAITVVFGRSYLAGTTLFVLLTLTHAVPALTLLYSSVLQGLGETGLIAKAGASAAIIELVAAVLLVPYLGAVGAALARIFMYTCAFLLYYRKLRVKAGFMFETAFLPRLSAATLAIALPLAFVDWNLLQLTIVQRLIAMAATFPTIAILTNRTLHIVQSKDLDQISNALPKPFKQSVNVLKRILVA